MSTFKQQFQAIHAGSLSVESDEINISPPDSTITNADVIAVREEREVIKDCVTTGTELRADINDVGLATAAVDNVANAVMLTKNISPTQTDSFVDVVNESFESSTRFIGIEIPRLKVARDGSIDQESLEAFGDWFKSTGKSFLGSVSKLMARVKLNWSQLSTGIKGLNTRAARVKAKMGGRKGTGGKPLKLSPSIRQLLVKGDGYSGQLLPDVLEFSEFISQLTTTMVEYEKRVADFIKLRAFEAIKNDSAFGFDSQMKTEDLIRKAEEMVALNKRLLGNRSLSNTQGKNMLLGFDLNPVAPSASELIKHLDAPVSLTNDEINMILDALIPQITKQLTELDAAIDSVDKSYGHLYGLLQRLNNDSTGSGDDEYSFHDMGDDVDSGELLRIQYKVVHELGSIGERLQEYFSEVAEQFNAILVLTEESIFQD